ncbi:MAG: hypothetical protein ACOZQL_32245 [Myxococcota bacterium]
MTTAKALFSLAGLWLAAGLGWLVVTGLAAAATEHSRGDAVTVAMFASWGAGLVLSAVAVLVGRLVVWRWLPPGQGRLALILSFGVLQGLTCLASSASVLLIFNR